MKLHEVENILGELLASIIVSAAGAPTDCTDAEAEAWGALKDAYLAGRNWDWLGAEEALDRAYAAFGKKRPESQNGVAWHRGKTRIQAVARDALREMERDW